MNSWIIEIIGPGPSAGHWVEDQSNALNDTPTWKWRPFREETFQFIFDDGEWVFEGREPVFNWDTNKWKLIGANSLRKIQQIV